MKNFSYIFIGLAVILALSFGFVPFGVVAQETGNLQPPPSSSSQPPPPPPPSSEPSIAPAPALSPISQPSEPSQMPPPQMQPPPSMEPPRMPPPPQGQTDFRMPGGQIGGRMMQQNGNQMPQKEPSRMHPPPQESNRMPQKSMQKRMPEQEQKSNHMLKQESPAEFEKDDFEESFEQEEQEEEEEYVDPKEIKDALRQLKDIKQQAKSTLKRAQKTSNFTNEIEELNGLVSEITRLSDAIQGASGGSEQREAIREFYDAQLWDTFNNIRIKIEFPQELKNIEKDLKRVDKLMSSKRFSIESIDMNVVRAKIEEIRNAINEARSQFNNGNFEDAREALSVIHEGSHPGEIFGVLNQLREIDKRLKSLKSEIKSVFAETLQPVFEAINEGDFREANMMLNEIQRELWKLFDKAKGRSSRLSEDMRQKLQNLERQLENKQQQIEKQRSSFEGEQSIKHEPYKPYQASVAETLLNWFR